jgi:hypothetical protein
MLTFAVAVARPGRALPTAVTDHLGRLQPPELPFGAAAHLKWDDPSGTVSFAGWQDAGREPGAGCRWDEHDGGVTALTGWTWPRRSLWRPDEPWSRQVARALAGGPAAHDGLLGVFTAVALDREGRGTIVTDALGLSLVYRAEGDGVTVFSSRASLAAAVAAGARPPRRDPIGACWLAYGDYLVGAQTTFAGVEVVPEGATVVIEAGRGARLEAAGPRPWRFRTGDPVLAVDPHDLIDEVQGDIAASIRAALSLPVAHHLCGLTGGKDSRLVLAVALAEGLAGDLEFRTWGASDLPDVVIARRLAEMFGLDHRVGAGEAGAPEPGRQEGPAGSHREWVMRRNVGSWSGMRNVAEPKAGRAPLGDRVLLSGACGEALATNYPGVGRPPSREGVEPLLRRGWKLGTAGIQRPEAREH